MKRTYEGVQWERDGHDWTCTHGGSKWRAIAVTHKDDRSDGYKRSDGYRLERDGVLVPRIENATMKVIARHVMASRRRA
jgi:hypothetical protein